MPPPNTALQRTRSAPLRSPLSFETLGATKPPLWLMFLPLCLLISGCAATNDQASQAVGKIRNSDIAWDGNYFGLLPRIEGQASKSVMALGESAVSALIRALDDPSRFAAAHVLLTEIKMRGVSRPLSARDWNGLRVELSADGHVQLHPEQREELKVFWRERNRGA